MKWTDETISSAIHELMKKLNIDRMPTNTEMKENQSSGLSRAMWLTGGVYHWSEKLGLPMKEKEVLWTDERIKEQVYECMQALQIDRMPVANELKMLGRNDVHCALSKSKLKYSGWAKHLGLELKSSETKKGNEYEAHVAKKIQEVSEHLRVERMTTKHPYDLLINECVKVDVKVGKAHNHFGSRAHTFGLHKECATCDVYICVALDENDEIEKYFIIPASHARVVTLNIGTDSKYNKYIDNWNFIYHFVNGYERALAYAL